MQRIATFHLHHPSNNPLQLVPFCSETKVTSTSEVIALYWDEELIMDADVPSFIEQFPKQTEQIICKDEAASKCRPGLKYYNLRSI